MDYTPGIFDLDYSTIRGYKTEDMWNEFVADKVSTQEDTFTYNRETGEVSHTKSMTLE